jgi:hypothetical protein
MQAMAVSITRIALATGKRGCLKTVSKTELAIGLMQANVFCSENGCLAIDCNHEVNGRGCNKMMLLGGRVDVLQ